MPKKILVLSGIYPADDIPKAFTPVAHYFTREWVKSGHHVFVVHYKTIFPGVIYSILKLFQKRVASKVGYAVATSAVADRDYSLDGVNVRRICLKKTKPHGRYPAKEIEKAFLKTLDFCQEFGFVPDAIISHWSNPQLELMCKLKEKFNVPTCYVAHDAGHFLEYGKDAKRVWDAVDIIGYRSAAIKRRFETSPEYIKPSFMCYSGIPASYNDNTVVRMYDTVRKVAYVGTLIERKYPAQIIPALVNAKGDDFEISYAGEGQESNTIKEISQRLNVEKCVKLLGRIDRDDVIRLMDESDLFIMISKNETYGLVYLEAMARGCITIASKNEGFDGIIEDGVNGFLCDAGNIDELSSIIEKISSLNKDERKRISSNAMETAKTLTDENVATYYLNQVLGAKLESSNSQTPR